MYCSIGIEIKPEEPVIGIHDEELDRFRVGLQCREIRLHGTVRNDDWSVELNTSIVVYIWVRSNGSWVRGRRGRIESVVQL